MITTEALREISLRDNIPEQPRPYSGIIVIDGGAGAGKGSLAEDLSAALNLKQCSAGDMYRAVTYYLTEILKVNPAELSDEELAARLADFSILPEKQDGQQHIIITSPSHGSDRTDVTDELHTVAMDARVSAIAKRNPVRDVIYTYQLEMLKGGNVIMEGRDMWKIVPDANLRIYLYASDEELIEREIRRKATQRCVLSPEEAWDIVIGRNNDDSDRPERGKMLTPQEAEEWGHYDLVIDTTDMTPDDVLQKVLFFIEDHENPRSSVPLLA